jgi:hypothetical protein
VLQVVEPHLNGPGGEVPIIGYDAGSGEVFVLDGQGPAPQAASPEAFAALGLDLVPGSGLLAACVPAAFGTWMLLLAAHGRLRLREVMEYAIGYARQGYPVVPGISTGIASVAGAFRDHWPTSAEIYLADEVPAPGARFANPVLAATYRRLLDEAEAAGPDREAQIEGARRAFYQGFVAEAIGAFLERAEVMDVTGEPHRALLAPDDLARWQARAEPPGHRRVRGADRVQDRAVGPGPGVPAATGAARGVRSGRHGAGGVHPHRGGVRQAGVRGPGSLVRRPPGRWRPAPRAAVGGLRGAAPRAGRARGVAGPPPGQPGRRQAHAAGYAAGEPVKLAAGGGRSGEPVAGLANPGLGDTGPAGAGWAAPRAAATPATSTSPTGSATWSPPPPAGAGCRARR